MPERDWEHITFLLVLSLTLVAVSSVMASMVLTLNGKDLPPFIGAMGGGALGSLATWFSKRPQFPRESH